MPPLTIMVKPASELCNLRCGFCFCGDITFRREVVSYGIMNIDTLDKLMYRAFSYGE